MQAMVQVGDQWRSTEKRGAPLNFVDRTTGDRLRLALVNHDAKPVTSVAIEVGPDADEFMKWRMARGKEERERRRATLDERFPAEE